MRPTPLALAAIAFLVITAAAFAGEQRSPASAMPVMGHAPAGLPKALDEARLAGGKALYLNAALSLGVTPLEPARPFVISGSEEDRQRALLCLSQAVYYEAGFEPLEGRRAVAQVVLNRVRHPAFPKSICGVVYQGEGSPTCQFSFVCNGDLDRPPGQGAWLEAERVAREALSGYVEASVGEATHYHADYVSPRWAPLLAKVGAIGHHIFYRWPGTWGEASAFTGRYAGESGATEQSNASASTDSVHEQDAAESSQSRISYQIAALLDASLSSSRDAYAPQDGSAPALSQSLGAAGIASGK